MMWVIVLFRVNVVGGDVIVGVVFCVDMYGMNVKVVKVVRCIYMGIF